MFSPSAKSVQCLCFFYALTVPSPHVFAISLSSSAAWRSQHTPPSSLCLVHIHMHYYFIAYFLISRPICLDTFNPLFLSFIFVLHSLNYMPTHTSSLPARLLTLGTIANTLDGLQSLAQLQLAVVLNRTWLKITASMSSIMI